MEFNKVNYFERVETSLHREFIIAQNNCVLCGTVLELRHLKNHVANNIKEEAFCSHCDLKTRAKHYSLH